MMKIINEPPPNIHNLQAAFQINMSRTYFTYADTLYNPSGKPVSDDLLVHEETHSEQQFHDPEQADLWWGKYLRDPKFRVEQEGEAYGQQYRYLCSKKVKDPNQRVKMLHELSTILSGPLYGHAVGFRGAWDLITHYAKRRP